MRTGGASFLNETDRISFYKRDQAPRAWKTDGTSFLKETDGTSLPVSYMNQFEDRTRDSYDAKE